MTNTSQRRSPPSEGILQEWAKHWPFERASAKLIRKAQQAERQRKGEAVRDVEEALF